MRLAGKVMAIELKELNKTLTLVFAENHVDVLASGLSLRTVPLNIHLYAS